MSAPTPGGRRVGAARRSRLDRGAVSLEFLIVLFPILLLFFAVVQLALIGAARLVVAHAASRAARSAAVVIDDSPSRYGGEPRGHLDTAVAPGAEGHGTRGEISTLSQVLDASRTRSRLETIRFAASAPLSAVAPSAEEVTRWFDPVRTPSVGDALGSPSLLRAAFGILLYNDVALAVATSFDDGNDLVRVRVEYLLHCGVPLVDRLMCQAIPAGAASRPDVPNKQLLELLSLTSERFSRLSAEAAWPRQRYHHGGGDV